MYDELKEEIPINTTQNIPAESFVRKNRVRKAGKTVQRRKKVATRSGFTFNQKSGRSERISQSERRNRSLAAKKSAPKRKAKSSIGNLNRKKSNRRRAALGFDK